MKEHLCTSDIELLTVGIQPYYLPRNSRPPSLSVCTFLLQLMQRWPVTSSTPLLPRYRGSILTHLLSSLGILITSHWTKPSQHFTSMLTAPPETVTHWIFYMQMLRMHFTVLYCTDCTVSFSVHLIHHWLSVQHQVMSPAEVFWWLGGGVQGTGRQRKRKTAPQPLHILGKDVEVLEDYKYVGVTINHRLDWRSLLPEEAESLLGEQHRSQQHQQTQQTLNEGWLCDWL